MNYGLLVGLGIGFAYGAPIAACNKWFPDKKGLVTGLVVFGSNALGRIFWGLLGDKIGRAKALTIDFLACLIALLIISGLFFIQPLFIISI
ncbi:hypothetical protein KEJ34_01870 [Candidatus Bathyarchaeota archaeon]|nr:hypothetical protein [Candidatus Bathyarchaeota archaeon]